MRTQSFFILVIFLFVGSMNILEGQIVRVKLEVTNVWFNAGGDGAGNKPDPTWKISASVPFINAAGNVCIHRSGVNHGSFSRSDVIFDHSAATPWPLAANTKYILVSLEAWEDDRGGSCSYNCCNWYSNDDDVHSTGSTIKFFYPNLAFQGDVHNFSVTTNSGHFRADLKATVITQDVYAGAMAVTALDGGNLPILCEGDTYRVDANMYPNFFFYNLQWQRKQGNGSWVNHTVTSNVDNIQVTATVPRTDYRARVLIGSDEQNSYRSTENLNITIGPAPPNVGDVAITPLVFCEGESGSVRVDAINNVDQNVNYNFTLSAPGITIPNQSSTPANLPITFTNLPDATYQLAVVAANANTNCAAFVNNILVDAAALPTVATASVTDAYCNGQNGSVYVQMSGTSGGNNIYELRQGNTVVYTQTNSQSFRNFSSVTPDDYDVVVINSNGCESAATPINVGEPTAVAVTSLVVDPGQGGFNVACNGGTAEVIVNMSGGTGNLYRISGSFGNYYNQSSPATIYLPANGGTSTTIEVRDSRNCLTTIESGPITEPATAVSLTIDNTTATGACNMVGTMDASATGGAGSFTYYVDGDATNSNNTGSFTGLGGGAHTAYVEDAAGCVVTESFTITQAPNIIFSVDNITIPTCFGDNDGSLSVSATGGVPPFTYSFNGGDFFSSTSDTTGLETGTYEVVVRDSDPTGPCELTEMIFVWEPAEIFVTSIDYTPLICNGELATLTVNFSNFSAAFSFFDVTGEISLDGGSTWQDINPFFPDEAAFFVLSDFLPGSATPYEIMFRDPDGCTSTNITTLTLEDPPAFDFTGTPTNTAETCFDVDDGTITASVSGGREPYIFTLYNDDGIVAQSDPVSAIGGIATVTFSDLIPETAVMGVEFFGYAVGVTDGSTLAGATADCAVVYPPSFDVEEFILLDGGDTMISIDEGTDPVIGEIVNTGPVLNCFGEFGNGNNGEVTVNNVSDGTPPYEYSSDGIIYQTSNVLTDLGFGPTIYVRDANGCITSQGFFDFEFPPQINTVLTPVEPATACTKGSFQVDLSNGTGPYIVEVFPVFTLGCEGTFLFESADDPLETVSTDQTSFIIDGMDAGEYELAIYDETTGCLFCSGVSVVVPEIDAVSVVTTRTEESCDPGNDATISFAITGGTAPYTTEINFADPQTGANPVFTDLSAENPYTFRITDDYGCQVIFVDSVELVTELDLIATTTDISTCAGEETGTLTVEVINGTPPYSLQWNEDGMTPDGGEVIVLGAGETSTRNNLAADEYEFTIVDANGCAAELVAYVTEPDSILLDTIIIVNASCEGIDDGEVTVEYLGGTGNLTYALDGGTAQNNGNYTGLSTGDHSIIVTDDNGCTTTLDFTVEPDYVVAVDVDVTNASCNGVSDGILTFTPISGSPLYWYSVNGSDFSTANPRDDLPAGIYEIVVRDGNACFATLPLVEITEPDPLSGTVTVIEDATCTTITGILMAEGSGGTPPYTYVWDGVTPGSTLNNAAEGNHTVVITDAQGCTFAAAGAISIIPAISLELDSSTDEICDQQNGTITVAPVGGTAPFSYAWSNGNPDSPTATGLAAGDYTITVTDANTCTAEITVTIDNLPPPTLSILDVQNSLCTDGNGSITVEAIGGTEPYMYSIDAGPLQASPTFENLNADTDYLFTVVDADGCTNTITGSVGLELPPTINLITTEAACDMDDGTILAGVTGGLPPYSYAWSAGGSTDNQADNLAPGDYTVTVTDANNCTAEATATITEVEALAINLTDSSNEICGGANGSATVSVTGGTLPYEYEWSIANPSTPSVSNLPAGVQSVTVTDARGCVISLDITIEETEGPSSVDFAVENTICTQGNGSITATTTGGTEPYSYAWSHDFSLNGDTATGLTSGNYSLTVTDANGCTIEGTAEVLFSESPTIDEVIANNTVCENGNGSITIAVSGGTEPYTYEWDQGIGIATETITNLNVGTYTVTVTDALGCTAEASASISLEAGPILFEEGGQDENCGQQNGSIIVYAIGGTGTPPFEYEWSHDPDLFDFQATGLSAGTYSVTFTDANGCESVLTHDIENIGGPTLSLESVATESCGQMNGAITVSASGGSGAYTYEWQGYPAVTGPNLTGLSSGTYTVFVTDSDNCSTDALEVEVTQVDGPIVSLVGVTDDFCVSADAIATVQTTGGTLPYNYQWSHDNSLNSAVATDLSTGTYMVSVTDGNNCETVLSIDVVDTTSPELSIGSITDSQCGLNDGAVSIIVSGGTAPYQFTWTNGTLPNSADISNLAPGSYTLLLTDANDCTATITAEVAEYGAQELSITEVIDAACNDNEGLLTIGVTGAVAPYSYEWSHDNTLDAPTATGLSAGDYIVTVTDNVGCERTITGTVGTLPVLEASIANSENSNCVDGLGSISIDIAGGLPPYSVSWSHDAGETAQTITNLNADTYTATVTDANGCTAMVSQTIELIESPELAVFQQMNPDCGQTNGFIDIDIIGGTAPFDVVWSHNGSTDLFQGNLDAGDYTINVTDALGCQGTLTVTLTQLPDIQMEIANQADEICGMLNGTVEVNVLDAGDFTYAWSHDNNLDSPIATGLSAGDYTITVNGAGFCPTPMVVTIGETSGPELGTPVVNNSDCNAATGSATFNTTSGVMPYTYAWSHDNTLNAATANNLAAGVYYVTVTDDNGCEDIEFAIVSDELGPDLVVIDIVEPSCLDNDGSITVEATGAVPPYTFSWSHDNSLNSVTADNLSQGGYFITVADANNCITIIAQSLMIADPLEINVISQNNSICGDGNGSVSVEGSGGVPPYSFAWSHDAGETGSSLSNLNAGMYTVTMTDNAGCTIDLDFEILLLDSPTLTLVTSQDAICTDNGSVTVETTGGAAPYTYSWSHDLGLNSATAGALAIGTYTVTVTDDNDCTNTLSVEVGGALSPTLTAIPTDPSCTDGTGMIEIQVDGGTEPFEYEWSHSATETTNTATNLEAATYTVTVTDANNCTAVISQELIFQEAPTLSIASQSNSLCTDDNGTIEVTVSGGTAPFVYTWQHDADLDASSLNNLAAGFYEVTVTDGNGCTDVISTTLEFTSGPVLSWASVTNAFCGDDNGALELLITDGFAPFDISWNHDPALEDLSATGLAIGDYSVTVTDANGCESILTSSIVAQDLLITFLTIAEPTCGNSDNGSLMATVEGGLAPYTYIWSTGDSDPTITGLSPDDYAVTIIDANGCENSDQATLENLTDLTFDFVSTSPSCNGDSDGQAEVMVTGGSGNYTYLWDVAGNTATALVTDITAGTYQVTVNDDAGCSTIGTVTVDDHEVLSATASATVSCLNLLNGTALAEPTGGTEPYTYLWDDPSAQETATAIDLLPGQFNVQIVDANGCSTSTSTIVTAAPAVEVEITSTEQPDCLLNMTGSATVEATSGGGGYIYLWDDPSVQVTATAASLDPGTYGVTVTDMNGCYASTTADIIPPGDLLASVSAISSPACVGEANASASVQVANGSGNFTYLWDAADQQTTATLSGVNAGTYNVTITDEDDGCFTTQEVIIPDALPLTLDLMTAIGPGCGNNDDGSAVVSAGGGAGDFTYSWDDPNNQATAFADNLPPGDYVVTATDVNGCEITLDVNIPEGADLTAEINTSSVPTCFGIADGSATVTLTGSSGNNAYQWDDVAFQQTETATGLSPGTYNVMVTDLTTGCEATAMVEIDATPELVVTLASSALPSCSGFADGSLSIDIAGGTGATTILWDDPAAQTTMVASGLTGGTYNVTVTDDNLCETIETYDLMDAVALTAVASQVAPLCYTSEDGSVAVEISGGSMPYTYEWDDPAVQNTSEASNLPVGTYTVIATDDNGCFITEMVTLTTTAAEILITENITDPSCLGGADGAINVAASGGAGGLSYSWNTGDADNAIDNLIADSYILTVTDADGCIQTAQYDLTEGAPFVIDLGLADTTVCAGEYLIYDFSGLDYQIDWTSDQGFASTEEMVLLETAATYTMTATNSAGCVASDQVSLSLGPDAFQALFIAPTDVVIANDVVVSEVSWPKPDEVEWFFPTDSMSLVSTSQNQYIFSFDFIGEYELTMRAMAGGCEDWITKTIIVHADSTTIPSPFTAQPELLDFSLSPNPNTGNFDVTVELSDPKLIALSIFGLNGVEFDRRVLQGQALYTENYSLALIPGTYICVLQTPTQRKTILFTVI